MTWIKLVSFGQLFGVFLLFLVFFISLLAVATVFVFLGCLSYVWGKMKKLRLTLIFILFLPFHAYSHPDGSTPYWFPSSYIYGFVKGCADTVEINRAPITQELWPEEIRNVCGCVLDSLRHSIPFQESIDNESQAGMQLIVSATMPICINEEQQRKQRK